jgi:hypothetical protein
VRVFFWQDGMLNEKLFLEILKFLFHWFYYKNMFIQNVGKLIHIHEEGKYIFKLYHTEGLHEVDVERLSGMSGAGISLAGTYSILLVQHVL